MVTETVGRHLETVAPPWIAEQVYAMRLYALTELHDPEAIELFITEEDARRALEDCLRDEPEWSSR
jgi:hypothetical protein